MSPRRFLFLQGPHGPFFAQLGAVLRGAGHAVWRVGFTAGDRVFWRGPGYIAHRSSAADWPAHLQQVIARHAITDVVAYGDHRGIHRVALEHARTQGLRTHVFEEGYLRPHWISYERAGANGGSALTNVPTAALLRYQADTLAGYDARPRTPPPDRWGDTRQHAGYSALYHACVAVGWGYANYVPHRGISVWHEARLTLRRVLCMPYVRLARRWATARVIAQGQPYHLVLLQLSHDAQFRAANPYGSQAGLIAAITQAFATQAPRHHHLVFKAHPFEDGREDLQRAIRRHTAQADLTGRIHFVQGGKLAPVLDEARSALTVNSTAGQQVLWRGLPLCALGPAPYRRPGLASDQTPEAFFANPIAPDPALYDAFRAAMLATSQIPGSFYTAPGRCRVLRQITDRMLAPNDAYDRVFGP
ncbi:MAG: capsule biosynthesis protein, partial [Paracoccaceae bacterium]